MVAENPDEETNHQESPRAPSYALGPAQQDLLAGKQDLEESPRNRLRTIRDQKVKRINERISRLCDDIELMDQAAFFESGWDDELWERVRTEDQNWATWDWAEYWEDLITMEPEWARIPAPFHSNTSRAGDRRAFGAYLGHMIRCLSRHVIDDEARLDIIMGFIRGVMFPANSDRYTSTESLGPERLHDILVRIAERGTVAYELEKQQAQAVNTLQENLQRQYQLIDEALVDYGIEPSTPVYRAIQDRADFSSPFFRASTTTRETDRQATNQAVQELVQTTNLRQLDQLAEWLTDDLNTLSTTTTQGLDPLAVFTDVYNAPTSIGHTELGSKDNAGPLNATLYRLADTNPNLELLTHAPLVEQYRDEWTTTTYGDLLGHCHQNDIHPREWLHRIALSPESTTKTELVDKALADLDL